MDVLQFEMEMCPLRIMQKAQLHNRPKTYGPLHAGYAKSHICGDQGLVRINDTVT